MDQTRWRLIGILRLSILVLGLVGCTGGAKPPLVMSLVDRVVAFRRLRLCRAAPEFTDTLVVKRLASAHEHVVAAVVGVQAKLGSHLFEITDHVIRLFFWRAA